MDQYAVFVLSTLSSCRSQYPHDTYLTLHSRSIHLLPTYEYISVYCIHCIRNRYTYRMPTNTLTSSPQCDSLSKQSRRSFITCVLTSTCLYAHHRQKR